MLLIWDCDLTLKTRLVGIGAGKTEVIWPSIRYRMVSVSTLNLLPNFISGTAMSATPESPLTEDVSATTKPVYPISETDLPKRRIGQGAQRLFA